MKLSVIIPVYNEERTILKILKKINQQKKKMNIEIIVSDDGSDDKTKILLQNNGNLYDKIIFNKKNKGKGAAIISAKHLVSGKIVIIQDADLEYDPSDYQALIDPIASKRCRIVYGSRVLGKKRYSNKNFISLGRIFFNHLLTVISNILNHQNLTDAHTGYKVYDSKIFKSLPLKENGFAFCPEVTSLASKLKEKIIEIPIKYKGRTYQKGKKINFIDGLKVLYVLFKYKFIK